ncbi:MAG: 50S ribosomal protein L27 [Candidatus Omnitrophica bacterium]|nr:50S ribosomal protein L27 [Candidatus Omnitrophota bacterium]
MVGGFSRPKKDKRVKITEGEAVKTGQILVRGLASYKAGKNVKGESNLHALCNGKVHFTKKKTSHGKVRTFLNVEPTK